MRRFYLNTLNYSIYLFAIFNNFKMQMRTSTIATTTYVTDNFTFFYIVTRTLRQYCSYDHKQFRNQNHELNVHNAHSHHTNQLVLHNQKHLHKQEHHNHWQYQFQDANHCYIRQRIIATAKRRRNITTACRPTTRSNLTTVVFAFNSTQ